MRRDEPRAHTASDTGTDIDEALMHRLASRLARPVTVVAVGSSLRGDDAFGVEVARELRAAGPFVGVEILEGGVVPENLAERIARKSPTTVLVLDTARFEGRVGELRLLDPSELGWSFAGTHAPSLDLLSTYLARRCGARTVILAPRAGKNSFRGPMSRDMREAVRRAASLLRRILEA